MPTTGRAAAVRSAALYGLLYAQALRSYPPPPWDYDDLQVLRTPHPEAPIITGGVGDVISDESTVYLVGTATVVHPVGHAGPLTVAALAMVSWWDGAPTLYGVVELAPPITTTPERRTADGLISCWDSYPGG